MNLQGPYQAGSSSVLARMFGAALLSRRVYGQIAGDSRGPYQAGLATLLISLVAGLTAAGDGALAITVSLLLGFAVWLLLGSGIYLLGNGVLRESTNRARLREVLAVIGFSQSPGMLLFLALVPVIGTGAAFAVGLWQLWAAVIATQVVFGFRKPFRSASVVLLVWLPLQVLFVLAISQLDFGAPAVV